MTEGLKDVCMRVNGVETKVGTAKYKIYETVEEATDDLGAEDLLQKLNSQVRTDEMNRVRGLVRGGPGVKALEAKAVNSLTADEWDAIRSAPTPNVKLQEILKEKIEALKAEALATIGAATEEATV